MVNISDLEIPGFKGQSVGGKLFKQETPTQHLAVIFPGYGYTCDRALLHYTMQFLLNQGADALQVNYAFANKPGFWQSGEETRAIWFGADATMAMQAVLEKGDYRQITLVGKSLGTLAVGHLANHLPEMEKVCSVFFTPLLKNPRLVQQIITSKGQVLLAVGTDDALHAPDNLQIIQAAREVHVIEVTGGDHSLEIKSDVMKSLELLAQVMAGVEQFLRDYS